MPNITIENIEDSDMLEMTIMPTFTGSFDGSIIPASEFDSENTVKDYIDGISYIPTMSASVAGIAKVGSGLEMSNGALQLASADIDAAVADWLSDHPEATTTVQDGSITDAKLVQTGGVLSEVHDIRIGAEGVDYDSAGDAVRYQIDDVRNNRVAIPFELVAGKYVNRNGTLANDAAWSATDFIECNSGEKLYISTTIASNWTCFYKPDKTAIVNSYFNMSAGENVVVVPYNAGYVKISNKTTAMEKTRVARFADEEPAYRTIKPIDLVTKQYPYNSGYGIGTTNNPYVTTWEPIKVSAGDTITLEHSDTFTYWYAGWWLEDGTGYTETGWKRNDQTYVFPSDGYMRFAVSPTNRYDTAFVFTDEHLEEIASIVKISTSDEDFEHELKSLVDKTPKTTIMGFGPDIFTPVNPVYVGYMRDAITAMMLEYKGDARKIPLIIHTDQHNALTRSHRAIFMQLAQMANWDEFSAVFNLGDTVSNNWTSDNTFEDPYMRNQQLENALYATRDIPKAKQINVIGNHDTWGIGWNNASLGDVSIPLNYLEQYFNNNRQNVVRYPDNSGNFVVYDGYFGVKYLVIGGWDYTGTDDRTARISSAHWDWIIGQLSANDGYDIIVVSHQPIHFISGTTTNSITGETITVDAGSKICDPAPDAIFTARKTKTSGTYTDSSNVVHQFDFSSCTTDLVCSLHGHMHYDGYMHLGSSLLEMSFDKYLTDWSIHFVLIDRLNEEIKVWKVSMEGANNTPLLQSYYLPLTDA